MPAAASSDMRLGTNENPEPAGASLAVVQEPMEIEERVSDDPVGSAPDVFMAPRNIRVEETCAPANVDVDDISNQHLPEATSSEVTRTSERILTDLGPGLLVGQYGAPRTSRPSLHRAFRVTFDRVPLVSHIAASLKSFTASPKFEMSCALMIVGNAITMAFEMQYQSFDLAHELAYTSDARPSHSTWPVAKAAIDTCGIAFGVIFAAEVLFKSVVLRSDFLNSWWNMFDAALVTLYIIDSLIYTLVGMNPTLFRVLRLLRLVRLSRMVKTLQALDSLQVLIGSITACSSVLLWSGVVLGFIFNIMSIFMNAMLTPYMKPDGEGDLSLATRQLLFTYFGSYTRSLYTMLELTTGNFIPVTRLLTENIGEGYGAFLFIYRFIVGFAVIKVISGVFLHETFRVAASDDDLMIVQKMRATQKLAKNMKYLLCSLDRSHDGAVDRAEFLSLMSDERLKVWLMAMDVEVENVDVLFDMLANGADLITVEGFIKGISRLRGPARSIDLVAVAARCEDLRDRIMRIDTRCGHNDHAPRA
eukprot:NODE_4505_length_1883_cov_5.449317.p1 GENE.NODE_4505_length_1883_cov_5.449317~~NODE_4505_length_1883_cov_5.449317.p1  ORF type:complete len:571 (-),score=140.50 NODE_4505_length_1883_cov_5.449317:169-1764(-)